MDVSGMARDVCDQPTYAKHPTSPANHEAECLYRLMQPAIEAMHSLADEVRGKVEPEDRLKMEDLYRQVDRWREDTTGLINRLQKPGGPFHLQAAKASFLHQQSSMPLSRARDAVTMGQGLLKAITGVALSGDGKRVVTASSTGTIKLWKGDTGEVVGLPGAFLGTSAIGLSFDGRKVLLGKASGMVEVWDGLMGKVDVRYHCHNQAGSVSSVSGSKDLHRIVAGTSKGFVVMFDGRTGNLLTSLFVDCRRICVFDRALVAMSGDGRHVAMCMKKTLVVWDARDLNPSDIVQKDHTEVITSIAISKDGRRIVTGSSDGTARSWESDGEGRAKEIKSKCSFAPLETTAYPVEGVVINDDGSRVVIGSGWGGASLWNAESGHLIRSIEGKGHPVEFVGMAGSGGVILTGSRDRGLKYIYIRTNLIPNDLLDPICQEPFIDPVELPCQHTFSRHTITSWLHRSQTRPVDHTPVTAAQFTPVPNAIVNRMLNGLPVRCPKGCTWTGARSDVHHHLRSCGDVHTLVLPTPLPTVDDVLEGADVSAEKRELVHQFLLGQLPEEEGCVEEIELKKENVLVGGKWKVEMLWLLLDFGQGTWKKVRRKKSLILETRHEP
ncbi:E3 ubiquitin-protein ligase NRDP1 [Rhizophlyctis rosea]|nr:E3 ubiquitin-protein ligase NRDP1 [Rhizophlyctis rosea]